MQMNKSLVQVMQPYQENVTISRVNKALQQKQQQGQPQGQPLTHAISVRVLYDEEDNFEYKKTLKEHRLELPVPAQDNTGFRVCLSGVRGEVSIETNANKEGALEVIYRAGEWYARRLSQEKHLTYLYLKTQNQVKEKSASAAYPLTNDQKICLHSELGFIVLRTTFL